jgi:phosphomethylpyrimidine synthase
VQAASTPSLPLDGGSEGGGDVPAGTASEEEAEAGMAEMSKRYNEGGRELYIGANGRDHD